MKRLTILLLTLITIAMLVGCTFTVHVPSSTVIDTQTLEISEAKPTSSVPVKLTIDMGAGELAIKGGSDQWVSGEVKYNIQEWKPTITRSDESLKISQGTQQVWNLPTNQVVNRWTLALGDVPMALTVNAGAYKGSLDLTGLPITDLEINDGASEGRVTFNEPNPAEMDRLVYRTGASSVSLTGLANANFADMTFDGGAGSYTLDFSGELRREARVKITVGVSNVDLIIPSNMNVIVEVGGGVNSINPSGNWLVNGTTYSIDNAGPLLTIVIDMGVGNLNLKQK
jgi:hypothetical protein